jgi:hypothetical protein
VKLSVYISVIVSIFLAVLAPALTGAAQTVQPPDVTLEGRLSLIWVDDPAQMELSLPPLVYLALEDGVMTRVIPDPQAVLGHDDLLALAEERVLVQGEWAVSPLIAASDVFLASSILLLNDELRPAAVSDFVLGNQRWLTILCKFDNIADEPYPVAHFQSMFANEYPALDHYWRELSYDKINLAGSMSYGWFTLPKSFSDYYYTYGSYESLQNLAQDCATAADSHVYFPDFIGVNFVFNASLGLAYGTRMTVFVDGRHLELRSTFLTAGHIIGLIAHEMGHAMGLPHSSGDYGNTYDNPWDVMSNYRGANIIWHPIYGIPAPHTIAFHKLLLGWISPERVFTATPGSPTTIHLERLALPQTENYLIAVIPKAGTQRYFYTLEARSLDGYDQQLPGNAVIIHNVDIERGNAPANLVDVDRNGNTADDGVMWQEGETFTDTTFGISVTIDQRTPTGFVVTIDLRDPPPYDCSKQSDISQKECHALGSLYESTGGNNWTQNWYPFTSSPCSWQGVSCSEDGKVKQLWLSNHSLTGSIPPEIGDLEFLEFLDLSNNDLSGPIPPTITNLAHLVYLELSNNGLSGGIPNGLGSLNLGFLDLSGNRLTGPIPTDFGNFQQMYQLHLQNNKLSGSIPPELGNASWLHRIFLSNNDLEGAIPSELAKLYRLEQLYLDRNRLSGSVPPQLADMPNLHTMDLSFNRLSGELSPAFANTSTAFTPFLSYNALRVSDPAVRAILDERDPGWEQTQTVAPRHLAASAPAWDRVVVSWSPVLYTADSGYYEIGCAIKSGGPYQPCGKTAGKNDTGITLLGLAPGRTHYLAARTFTPAHGEQKNDLWSEYSLEVSVTVPVLLEPDPIQPLTIFFLPLIHP